MVEGFVTVLLFPLCVCVCVSYYSTICVECGIAGMYVPEAVEFSTIIHYNASYYYCFQK